MSKFDGSQGFTADTNCPPILCHRSPLCVRLCLCRARRNPLRKAVPEGRPGDREGSAWPWGRAVQRGDVKVTGGEHGDASEGSSEMKECSS